MKTHRQSAISQGTSLRLATRPWLISTGEYGGSGPPGKTRGPSRRRSAIFILGAIFCVTLSVGTQDKISISSRISTILAKFPAESGRDRDLFAAEIVAMGPEGMREIIGRLAAPGEDDDTLARFATDAAAVYVARAGAEAERLPFVKELLRALDEPRDAEIKSFLIGQLQLAGKGEIVKPLAKLLTDPKLGGPAARALTVVRSAEAEIVLIKALDVAPTENRESLIQALGEMRSLAAVKKISPYASGPDERLRTAALAALANIGDPASQSVLERTAVTASPYGRAKAASLYLLFAQRLRDSGNKDLSEKICREFLKNYALPGESQVRASALTLLAGILGPGIFDVLLEAMDSPDGKFRQRALELADLVPGETATARWIEKSARAGAEARADIIAMLGRRGDQSALPAVRHAILSEDKAVRLAAVGAASRLAGDEVFDEVWPLMPTDDEDQVAAVRQAFSFFSPDKVTAKAAEMLPGSPPHARVALIEILAERQAKERAGLILAEAGSENPAVRKAALESLEKLVRLDDAPLLVDLLLSNAAAPEIVLIQNALVASTGQIADPEMRADAILAALNKAPASKRPDLMRPLARIGGERALGWVVMETKSPDAQCQTAALSTLANWMAADALDELFQSARAAPDRKTRYLALRGITRLAGGEPFSAERKISLLKEALEIAAEANEKNLVISALADVRTPESLALLARFLDDPALQVKAAQAIVKSALPAPGVEGLAGFETAVILKRALLFLDNDYDRDEAEKYARTLLFKEGFAYLFNGKDLSGWKGLVADPPARARMKPDESARAQREADALMRQHWKVIDGALAFDGQGHSLCTLQDYGDFEMFVDWKIQEKGDSGIYLRGSPQVQIWDQTQSPDGSGGLYNNKINPSKPLVRADRPVGEWNTFYIRMAGERVTVYLNGVLVDDVVMENYWERDKPIYPAGQIELQSHNTPLYFKNLYLRVRPQR